MGLVNAQRTLDYIRIIAEFISQPEYRDVVTMFSPMNEAREVHIGKQALEGLYVAISLALVVFSFSLLTRISPSATQKPTVKSAKLPVSAQTKVPGSPSVTVKWPNPTGQDTSVTPTDSP